MLMDIDISNLADGQSREFSFEFAEAAELFGERLVHFNEPVTIKGSATAVGEDVAVFAEIKAKPVFHCDRCLTEVKKDISVSVSDVYFQNPESEECYRYTGGVISLDELVKERFVLSFPEYVVCKKDGKGLCPSCGTDLNINKCNCKDTDRESRDNPFAVLSELTSGGKNGSTKKKNI
ncbi:MAG: YceD family protein [Clostridiales bacterium]|jgi:uncharacterized protein|nr:YceD family protein [Clostridiales bacterium]